MTDITHLVNLTPDWKQEYLDAFHAANRDESAELIPSHATAWVIRVGDWQSRPYAQVEIEAMTKCLQSRAKRQKQLG